MAEGATGEYDRNKIVEATFKGILAKADRFRGQVVQNEKQPMAELRSAEAGKRMAAELFLDGVVAAQTLGKDQLRDLLREIEYREGDPDWAKGYELKLGLDNQAVAEWQHQQVGKARATRVKGLVGKLNPFRGDKGMDLQGKEL